MTASRWSFLSARKGPEAEEGTIESPQNAELGGMSPPAPAPIALPTQDAEASNMIVALRLRPLSSKEKMKGHRRCCRALSDKMVVIEKAGQPNGHLKSQKTVVKEYAYDIAFSESATQEQVYSKTVKDLIPTVLEGYQATVFAYGATGAGKTHTMMGSERDGTGRYDDDEKEVDGIIPRSLVDIFREVNQRKEQIKLEGDSGSTSEWRVFISYLEVYNEQIRDLLRPGARPLHIREDQVRGIIKVAGLHHEQVNAPGEALKCLAFGNQYRKTESTAANKASSRSHAVIQITTQLTITKGATIGAPKRSIIEGKLSLIDLAGSERASSTKNHGIRLMEGANINKSLLALANCINSLGEQAKKQPARDVAADRFSLPRASPVRPQKVQYRDSKLTHLLKNSLEGDCKLVMIANVNPSNAYFEESHNTLKYANRAKDIKVRPKANVITAEMTYNQRIEELEKENMDLRRALEDARAQLEIATLGPTNLDCHASSAYLK